MTEREPENVDVEAIKEVFDIDGVNIKDVNVARNLVVVIMDAYIVGSEIPDEFEVSRINTLTQDNEPIRLKARIDELQEKFVNGENIEGEYLLDKNKPTQSAEANTVKVTQVTEKTADNYIVTDTGKTVAEHNPHYPEDDRVVIGYYPNMGGEEQKFAFPESRLRETY